MKTLLRFLLFFIVARSAHAFLTSTPSVSTQSIAIPGNRYTLDFGVQWVCDDVPQNSAPGRIELVDGGGTVVGRVVASVYRPGNLSISVTGPGSVSDANASVVTYAPNGTPAEGELTGTWNITGIAPGNYTLRLYNYTTWESSLVGTTVWTSTVSNGGSAPQPPTIAWTNTPGAVGNGQSYTISA